MKSILSPALESNARIARLVSGNGIHHSGKQGKSLLSITFADIEKRADNPQGFDKTQAKRDGL